MLVFACDPGGRSGWATYDTETKQFNGGQLNNTDGHHLELWELMYGYYCRSEKMTLVFESFEFRNDVFEGKEDRKGLELVSRDYLGVGKLFSQMYDVKFIEQMPSHALRFVTNKRLEALELLHKPASSVFNKDYNAACKHLLHFLVVRLRIRAGITDKWRKSRVSDDKLLKEEGA